MLNCIVKQVYTKVLNAHWFKIYETTFWRCHIKEYELSFEVSFVSVVTILLHYKSPWIFFRTSLFHPVLHHFFWPLCNHFFLCLITFFLPIGPKGKYKLKLSASLPMVNALHTTVHTTQYVHNIRPKGGLISEGILALVPLPTKGAKSALLIRPEQKIWISV